MLINSAEMMYTPSGEIAVTVRASGSQRTDAMKMLESATELIANKKSVEMKLERKSEKRSLDANAYCWVLLGKLAAKIGNTPENIYRESIRDIGDNYFVYPIRGDAVERYCKIWESNGIGWITERMESKLDGYVNIVCYYGSSQYDTQQMSRLIDVVVRACEDQGIPTETPDEIAKRLSLWGQSS